MPRLHLASDTHGRQLPANWTCAHLGGRRRQEGGFYPACAIGSRQERVRWAAALKEGQLAAIRTARVELSQFIRPELERVRDVIGSRDTASGRPRREDLQAAWTGLDIAFSGFVEDHSDLFEAAGIESEALQRCFSEAMVEFSGRQWGREWQMADSVVSRYPWPIVAFFRPDLVRDGAVVEAQAPQ